MNISLISDTSVWRPAQRQSNNASRLVELFMIGLRFVSLLFIEDDDDYDDVMRI